MRSPFTLRRTTVRATLATAVALLLSACADSPTVPVDRGSIPTPVQTTAGSDGQRLARSLARALGDASVRGQLRDALRSSPWNEHKLELGEYAATHQGRRLVAAAAAAANVDPATVRQWIAGVGAMDLYVPLEPQRQSWAGAGNVVVGLNTNSDDPTLTGYAPDGSVVHLDARNGVPSQVVILLAPAEPKERRAEPGAATMDINGEDCGPTAVVECNLENGGANGPTRYLQSFIPYVADGWGDPELTIVHSSQFNGALTEVWRHEFGSSPQHERNYVGESTTFASFGVTVVEVWEQDAFLTGNDDYWGRANLAASGTATKVYGQCGTVYNDGDWYSECQQYFAAPYYTDLINTTDIWYTY